MKVVKTLPFIIEQRHKVTVGLVPTMGYLHEGHASLIRKARQECDIIVLSIFVNPLQFGPNEDFASYPRNTGRDLAIAEQYGVDIVFLPEVEVMYPRQIKTTVQVTGLTDRLCGASRPGHFDGVATVVSKLFHIIQPDKAYFGLKDAQQVAVISQMVEDLNMGVEIIPCPTLREEDGLAMSSRNVYLSQEERSDALILFKALELGEKLLLEHQSVKEAQVQMVQLIRQVSTAKIDYVDILTFPGLDPVDVEARLRSGGKFIIALAVRIGKTRLIDNRILQTVDRK